MPRLIEKGDPGTDRPILIDGIELRILPAELDAPPEPVSDFLDRLDGGSSEHQRRPWFDGVANVRDRKTFTFAYDQIQGDDRIKMMEIVARGGLHRITVWRMEPIIWTCREGVSRYYLPAFRKPAAHLYSGLVLGGETAGAVTVTTEAFPIDATLNGDALTVTYEEGPILSNPGTGGLVLGRVPNSDGEEAGYTRVRAGGTLVTGDELILWGVWTSECTLRSPGVTMRGQTESQAFVFVEV